MEEDIKILENLKENVALFSGGWQPILKQEEKQAIENLINRNKELEEKNKHLSSTSDYETICLECNNLEEQLEIANDKIKELEIEISRIPYFNKCWDTIYEMAVKNFKSKIIAKIEIINKRIDYLNTELNKCYIERDKLGTETDIDNNEIYIFNMEQEKICRYVEKTILEELLQEGE